LTSHNQYLAHLTERHKQGLVVQLTELRVLGPGDPSGTVWFSFHLDRHANDTGHGRLGGKGGIFCDSGLAYFLALWDV
jgi:hypothetical protein